MITESTTNLVDINENCKTKLTQYIEKLRNLGCLQQRFELPDFQIRLSGVGCYLKYNNHDNLVIFYMTPDFFQSILARQRKVFLDLFVELLSILYYGNTKTENKVFIRAILQKDKL